MSDTIDVWGIETNNLQNIDIRACSHKKSIKNHSQHDNRKKN